ncbi:MAG TPA: tRNA pseudouridine(55) synthase TruB [Methylomirabilota bacterium]|nr:tRNA pseudouridine(55) synthase TruB [Methylomirabilota bacterium]
MTSERPGAPRSGILPVEKGAGVTSFQVVAHLRRLLRAPKVGHGGTLDPDATGVLPILIGEGTKLTPYLTALDKEYVATARLGITTDTLDASGRILSTRPVPAIPAEAVKGVLARFVGEIEQVPPMYSALHHEGRRLYELAREGAEVERAPRRVTVHAIALESLALPELTFRVRCGKGTYVRVLAADLGEALGTGAALSALVRSRVGPYRLDDAVPWDVLREARDGTALWARVLPLDSALGDLPAVTLDARAARAFVHGQSVPARATLHGPARVYGPEGVLLGLGVGQGAALKPERLLHADTSRAPVVPR